MIEYVATVCIEDALGTNRGPAYNRAYEPGSGKARRALGTWEMTGRWTVQRKDEQKTPMMSFRVLFDDGLEAIGRMRSDRDQCVAVYRRA